MRLREELWNLLQPRRDVRRSVALWRIGLRCGNQQRAAQNLHVEVWVGGVLLSRFQLEQRTLGAVLHRSHIREEFAVHLAAFHHPLGIGQCADDTLVIRDLRLNARCRVVT